MKFIILLLAFLAVNTGLQSRIIYIEPVQNARYVSIYNNIIIGFDDVIRSTELNSLISVRGSLSGNHTGDIVITSDSKKMLFKPHQPFLFNETVEVTLNRVKTGNASINNIVYRFQTQVDRPQFDHVKFMENEDNPVKNNYAFTDNSLPAPVLTVSVSNNPTPGRIYLNNFRTASVPPYIMISNNDGSHYYTRQMPYNAPDFKKQPNGNMTYFQLMKQKFYMEDVNYNMLDSFYTGNGYITDNHDLEVLSNGHALLMSYDPQTVDMSVLVPGGNPNATVTGLIIQEIDQNKNVVFQWRSWDHYNIVDAIWENLTAANIDYAHGNAIHLDDDGNLMISARNLSEITKINRTTGAMIWRMGGVNNQFTFPNDSIPQSYQHDIRRIANGNITFYDNGNKRPTPFSRAVEYQIDEVNKIATLIWEYRATPDTYGPTRGSVQRLSNGNTFICWGSVNPNFTEVTQSGTVALEMSLPFTIYSYRGYKEELSMSLNMKLAIEGFYDNALNTMRMKDTVKAYLRNVTSPFSIIDSSKAVVDSASLTGNFNFYNTYTGTYYISLIHRNALETWSKAGGEFLNNGTSQTYNMTDLSSKAYGNNTIQVSTSPVVYALYSGDVNKDSFIDLTDVIYIFNDASSFVTGYKITDLTGNNITDLSDILIAYNNASNFVSVMRP